MVIKPKILNAKQNTNLLKKLCIVWVSLIFWGSGVWIEHKQMWNTVKWDVKSERALNLLPNCTTYLMKLSNKIWLIISWILTNHINLNSKMWTNVCYKIDTFLIIFSKLTKMSKFLIDPSSIKWLEIPCMSVLSRLIKTISAELTWKYWTAHTIVNNLTLRSKIKSDSMEIK